MAVSLVLSLQNMKTPAASDGDEGHVNPVRKVLMAA
jgi:hypothetical protein